MAKVKKVAGFGEVMGRLSPEGAETFANSNRLLFHSGGSEANVLANLRGLGGRGGEVECYLVTRLKEGVIGQKIEADLRRYGVNLEHVVWSKEGRNGLYFVTQGMGIRAAEVEYDRGGSAIALLKPEEIDWGFLAEMDAVFISGITPALSEGCEKAVHGALKEAQKHGCLTVWDMNYRSALWSGQRAKETMDKYIGEGLISILDTTERDGKDVFGLDFKLGGSEPIEEQQKRGLELTGALAEMYPGKLEAVVATLRRRVSAERSEWTSVATVKGKPLSDEFYYPVVIVDRPGAGDAFTAGLIYRLITESGPLEERVLRGMQLGDVMAPIAQTIAGDLGAFRPASYYEKLIGSEQYEIAR